ncbi:MAG TPA: hypothetical protein VGA73_01120 [Candidatus Binatia bacterium]
MECRDSRDGGWSISPCGGGKETMRLTYGNATLQVLIEAIGNLGAALQRMEEALKSREGRGAERKRSMHGRRH